jgi:hypothetical protein
MSSSQKNMAKLPRRRQPRRGRRRLRKACPRRARSPARSPASRSTCRDPRARGEAREQIARADARRSTRLHRRRRRRHPSRSSTASRHTPADRPARTPAPRLPPARHRQLLPPRLQRSRRRVRDRLPQAGRKRRPATSSASPTRAASCTTSTSSASALSPTSARPQPPLRHLGEFGYVLGTVMRVAALHPYVFPMRTDGAAPRIASPITFLSVNNSRFTGGKMMMAPDANTRDGLLDIIRVGELGRLSLLQDLPQDLQGHAHPPPRRPRHQAPRHRLRHPRRRGRRHDRRRDAQVQPHAPRGRPAAIDVRT